MGYMKQVIVMRRYFPDGKGGKRKVRTGKMIAQGAHASVAALLSSVKETKKGYLLEVTRDSSIEKWLNGGFAKIATYVDTEEELVKIYEEAQNAGLPCALITDSGKTEFGGKATKTCLAIGPASSDLIDKITGKLKLL